LGSRLHVRSGKGNKDRHVYIGNSAQRALWRYLATRPTIKPDSPLFATRDNTPIRRNVLYHIIERLAQTADVKNATTHRFRHTFAINLLRNGGNVLELQRLLGHEKLETIRIYVTLAQSDLSAAHRQASPADNWRL
jgi:site-specific recombinase XerD